MKQQSITNRSTSPEMEKHLFNMVPVLDKGGIMVLDYMGVEQDIVDAARVSYGQGTKKSRSPAALLRYLLRHRHTSPFEMCEVKFWLKMPIFIARQWLRHRAASVNEYSARYSILSSEFYVPPASRMAFQSQTNGQGSSDKLLNPDAAARVMNLLQSSCAASFGDYEKLVAEQLTRELARIGVPLATYTQFVWKIDLHNLMHFMSLRSDSHAQAEIQDYSNAIKAICTDWVPSVMEAFSSYRLNSLTLSGDALKVLDALLEGNLDLVGSHMQSMSAGEQQEIRAAIHRVNPRFF